MATYLYFHAPVPARGEISSGPGPRARISTGFVSTRRTGRTPARAARAPTLLDGFPPSGEVNETRRVGRRTRRASATDASGPGPATPALPARVETAPGGGLAPDVDPAVEKRDTPIPRFSIPLPDFEEKNVRSRKRSRDPRRRRLSQKSDGSFDVRRSDGRSSTKFTLALLNRDLCIRSPLL